MSKEKSGQTKQNSQLSKRPLSIPTSSRTSLQEYCPPSTCSKSIPSHAFSQIVLRQSAQENRLNMPVGRPTRLLRQKTVKKLQQTMGNQFIHRQIQRDPDGGPQDAGVIGIPAGVPEMPMTPAEEQESEPFVPYDLLTDIDPSSMSEDQLYDRLQRIQETLWQFNQSTEETAFIQEQANQIATVLAERQVEQQITSELESFLNEFSNITVTVRWAETTDEMCVEQEEEVAVHPPYFMNVNDRNQAQAATLQRYDAAMAHRRAADRATRQLLHEAFRSERRGGMGLSRASVGKSHPEDIQRILQTALDRNLINAGEGRDHPNSEDLRNWLVQYGIGIECSGFVSQALNRVTESIQGTPLAGNQQINTNSRGLSGTARNFTEITDPAQLQAGDTMYIPGHIRIITSARTEGGVTVFTTAEARAGSNRADVGPDRAEWRYQNGQLQIRRNPDDNWQNVGENPTFGRYERLESARTEAVERESQ